MDGNPNSNNPVIRLVWAPLEGPTIVNSNGVLRDWATLLVRVEELNNSGVAYNQITVLYGDNTKKSIRTESNPMNQIRKNSLRLPDDSNYELPWPPDSLTNWTAEKDPFTLVVWNEDTGDNAIRASTEIDGQEQGV